MNVLPERAFSKSEKGHSKRGFRKQECWEISQNISFRRQAEAAEIRQHHVFHFWNCYVWAGPCNAERDSESVQQPMEGQSGISHQFYYIHIHEDQVVFTNDIFNIGTASKRMLLQYVAYFYED